MKQKLLSNCFFAGKTAILTKMLMIVLLLNSASQYCLAQNKVDTTLRKAIIELNSAKKKDGKNLITTAKGIKLFANIQNGKVISLTATDGSGKDLPVSTSKPKDADKIVCLACVDNGGIPVCWEIDCKDLPRPPSTGGVKTQ